MTFIYFKVCLIDITEPVGAIFQVRARVTLAQVKFHGKRVETQETNLL
jgi:hypothetical protein